MPHRSHAGHHRPVLLVALLLGATRPLTAQAPPDIIRGRISAPDGKPVPQASVTVTDSTSRRFRSGLSDSLGTYRVVWTGGSGRYLVVVSAEGFRPFRGGVVRTGSDSMLVLNVTLSAAGAVQQLAPLTTTAQRPRPDRAPPAGIETGASEGTQFNQNAARRLSPDLAGDLAAIAGLTLPMATPMTGGFSVLGLGPGANSTTLNGMAFGGGEIPRDVSALVRVSASSYDPANGWFSGARTNLYLGLASIFTTASSHLTLDVPALQATDPVSARLGQRVTNFNGSVGGNGLFLDDKFAWNAGLQGGRRSAGVASLLDAGSDLLAHSGIAVDSATRLIQLLGSAGIPTTLTGAPTAAVTENALFLGRIDHKPFDLRTLRLSNSTWGITGYGRWNRLEGQGLGPSGTPAHTGQTTQATGAVQGEYTRFFGQDLLADLKSSITYSHNTSDPALRLPDGRVLVASTFPDQTGGVATLQFGGNGALQSDTRAWTWETSAETQVLSSGRGSHRIKLNLDSRFDGTRQDIAGNRLGTFSFLSLADLAANHPASFTRTLNAPTRRGGSWNGYLALGDLWRARPAFQLLYGVRLEANAFTERPANNPAVEAAFGARTDQAPDRFHLSPRLGFTWTRSHNGRPGGVIRGGIGEFRNLLDPSLLTAASVSTGLPGGISRISCLGPAVPVPDWTAYGTDPTAIPTACAGGGGVLSDVAPGVLLVDRGYTAQRSWRANLAWSSSLKRTVYTIEGIWSRNLNQAGSVDLNFGDVSRFTLPVEARPIFVTPAGIVPGTGAVSGVEARRSTQFGRVVNAVSDLSSTTWQGSLTVRPALPRGLARLIGDPSFTYLLSSNRAVQRGFDRATFGSPGLPETAPGDLDARHQFVMQTVLRPLGDPRLSVFLYGRLQSGTPFTPMVGSDINGDGLANDRAFIFAPGMEGDPSLASGLRSLMAGGSAAARDCLERQLGHAAARNSCRGPWTAALNASVRLAGQQLFHLPRVDVTVNLANPLGGLDRLFHGAGSLHGWGASPAPDPVLYTVRGFDPVANRFLYTVNPRFGGTDPSLTTIRAPFRLTLDISLDVGRTPARQQLDRWLKAGRDGHEGPRLSADDLKQRYRRNVPDPYAEIMQQSDSLLLSRPQMDSLAHAALRYRARMDSVWTALAARLAQLPDSYDAGAAAREADQAIDDAWEITRLDVQRVYPGVLTPVQLSMLPGMSRILWNARSRLHIRMFVTG